MSDDTKEALQNILGIALAVFSWVFALILGAGLALVCIKLVAQLFLGVNHAN